MDFWNGIRRIATALAVVAWLVAVAAGWPLGNGQVPAAPGCTTNCL